MIYIFDKKQAIIKVLTNDDFTAAHLNFKINTATTFEFSLPASKALPSGSKYVATPHPLNDSKFIMLRLTERVDNTETIDYSAYELAYQELATDGYIEDKRPHNQSALNLMKIALDGSNWELNNVNVSGTATTNFYYVDRLSAISKVVDLLGGEIVFYIEIQGNAISGRYMDYLARQGADTSKVFASGSNLLTVERQSDTSNIYTAILPRGKGKEIDNGDADTPDGYGRRINIADVEWKKSAGKPLDKPKGSIVLSDQDATAEWGQINGNARLLLQTYDDIDDVNVLINSAYKTLQSVNHPQIQYSATVADVGGLSLGDTVLIMHGDRDLSYKTRVFEVKYDLLSPDQTELSLGDDLSSNSITSQINNLNAVADTTSSQTQWTINQIGRPGTTYGATAPDSQKVGDIWFKYLPDGGTEIHRWNGNIWELLASPTTADDIAKAVNDAVSQAKSHTDEVKQGILSDIATAKSQAASLASTAEANAKSEATSLFSKAQDYVNQAKSDINDTINALSVGGRNYILDTANPKTQTSNGKDNQGLDNQARFYSPIKNWGIANGDYIISFDWTLKTALSSDMQPSVIFNSSPWQQQFFTIKAGQLTGHVEFKFKLNPGILTATKDVTGLSFLIMSQMASGNTITYSNLFMKSGTIITTWTQAPEDVVLDYTTKDNKIKETITQYQETTDGKVRKAQTDATTALGLVETKISQTDFNQKTGELLHNINEAKDTADKSLRTIGDYKTSNDKRVHDAESSIERNADAITAKVSQNDYDNDKSKLNTRFTKVEATANGASTTVGKLQTAVNNLGQVNQLFNTEFSPDLQGWSSSNLSNYLDYIDIKGVYNLSHVLHYNGGTTSRLDIQSQKIKIENPTQTFSISVLVKGKVGISVVGYKSDSDVAFSSWYTATSSDSNYSDWTLLTFNNKSIVSGSTTAIASIAFNITSTGNEFWLSQPMMVFASTVGSYVQGNYNNNAALAQVKITADSISNFVRDSSGNLSSNFQTALSKTSLITGSTLASSIQTQTATQISSALTDNNGKIISLINQDSSGVQIAGENLAITADTTVDGNFWAKQVNAVQVNASNITVGTLNGSQVNITNINAGNIVSGSISGANLNINLNTGSVVFQRGRIYNENYAQEGYSGGGVDINIDKQYIATSDGYSSSVLKAGGMFLSQKTISDEGKDPYFKIDNIGASLGMQGARLLGKNNIQIGTFNSSDILDLSGQRVNGAVFREGYLATIGGGPRGVAISGGGLFNQYVPQAPQILVGYHPSATGGGTRIELNAEYTHIPFAWAYTTSNGANLYIASDGALVRSSSSSKYKLDIEYEQQAETANRLLTLDPATWHDKFESEQLDKFHEIGVDPERTIDMSNRRYYGIIAEDLVKAGLEHLVSRNVETGEVEGVEYSKIGVALIPIIRDLRNRLNDQYVEIERLKEQLT